jgi:hypothetical protein
MVWSIEGRLISSNGTAGGVFRVAEMSFAQAHAGQAPTGFLSAVYLTSAEEYLVGMTSQLETVWGYLSLARIQRLDTGGHLLTMEGTSQSTLGVGHSVDYENDDQIALGLAVNPVAGIGTADYMAVYAKHQTDQPAQDFDIWSARIQMPAPYLKGAYLPFVSLTR